MFFEMFFKYNRAARFCKFSAVESIIVLPQMIGIDGFNVKGRSHVTITSCQRVNLCIPDITQMSRHLRAEGYYLGKDDHYHQSKFLKAEIYDRMDVEERYYTDPLTGRKIIVVFYCGRYAVPPWLYGICRRSVQIWTSIHGRRMLGRDF